VTPQLIRVSAVYEGGVLKPQHGPILGLFEGDRVEVVLVRVAPIDTNAQEELARMERIMKAQEEQLGALPPDPDEGYEEECKAFDEHRGGTRKLFPPEMKGITW
jgi:predicted DNA-binding antitoxin AbrB/MazE fold protein